MGYKYSVILFLLMGVNFFCANRGNAQTVARGFTHQVWTVDEGLPINSLNDITVTDDGFVWISTHNGMVRFDGLTRSDGDLFKIFNKGNNPAFSTNSVFKILEVNDSEFLVLENSVGQLQSVVGYRDKEFRRVATEDRFTFHYDAGQLDNTGTFWTIDDGKLYSLSEGGWNREFPSIQLKLEGYVRFRVVSKDNIWVLDNAGGELYHIKNGNVLQMGKSQGLSADEIISFEVTTDGTVWTLTDSGIEIIENGMVSFLHKELPSAIAGKGSLFNDFSMEGRVIYKTRTELGVDEYLVTKDEIQYLSPPFIEGENLELNSFSLITPLNKKNEGSGWLRVTNKLYYDGKFVFEHSDFIRSSFVDKAGGIWFVAIGELHYIKKSSFDSYTSSSHNIENVYPLIEDHEGVLWAGLLAPHVALKKGRKFERFTELNGINSRRYFSFLEDKDHNIWIGGLSGLFKWDRISEVKEVELLNDLNPRFIRGLLEDSNHNIWVGSLDDILSYSKEKGWIKHIISGHEGRLAIRFVYEDSDGTIWFGSETLGLLYYDENEKVVKQFEDNSVLTGQAIRSLYQDSEGIYWVGLDGYGLVRMQLDQKNRIIESAHYTQSDGLHGQVIHAILEDDYERMWMSSNSGIFWISKSELEQFANGEVSGVHSTVYFKSDGLPGMEANGATQSSAIKTADGRFLFAMVSGIAVVYPERINKRMTTVITRIDELITIDSTYISKSEVELTKEERNLQFTYAAFNFELAPKNIRYRYKLEGYDETWKEVGDRKEAFYTNVPGGEYNFVVQASLFGYDWSENQSELAIKITYYFYETLWFKILILISFIGLLYIGFRWRVQSTERRARELTVLVEEQTYQLKQQAEKLLEVDKAKSKFFANVSHEFRTPLTLIIGPLKDITKNPATISRAVTEKKAKLALRNSNRLLKLVNQILDISKVESGTMELQVKEVNIVTLVQSITRAFGSLAEQRQISITQEYFSEDIPLFIEADAIEKVMVNILSNAFKFTPPNSEILVSIKENHELIQIRIKDSGPGVEASELVHIFDRFYQTNESNTVNQVGTGIGLALSKELIELHKGSIKAESKPGSGLSIIVSLRKGNEHFEDSQIAEVEDSTELSIDELHLEEGEVNGVQGQDHELGKTTILIIDDNQEIRSYLGEHLESEYRVLESDNGLDGLAMAKKKLPDIIVCDIMMPKMDGYEFCKELKNDPETDFIPVILLTAKAEQNDKLEGLGLGADDYIMKPFDIEEVKARANNLIQSRKKLMDRFSKSGIKLELPLVDLPKAEMIFIEKIRDQILAGMEDENFGVEELAQQTLTSRRTLHNRIKKITNKGASDLIREIRLERAHQLLTSQAGTISEVAYSVGFKSIAHFSRVFKEHFKVNPSEVGSLNPKSS